MIVCWSNNFFLTHYSTKHSYILELKVLPKKDYEAKPENGKLSKAEVQWQEAEEQIKRCLLYTSPSPRDTR